MRQITRASGLRATGSTLVALAVIFTLTEAATFWHYTDPHVDWLYRPGSKVKHELCRSGKGDAGTFGKHGCQPPLSVQESAIKQMFEIDPNPAFIVHGGDSYPHLNGDSGHVAEAVYNSSHLLKKYFPNTPIIYALGNHDCYPEHQLAPKSSWLKVISEQLSDILNEYQRSTFEQYGYYVAFVGKLKILVLNTNYYFLNNFKTWFQRKDIANQWAYIKKELDGAKAANQKVLVVAHIPPGFSERSYVSEFKSKYDNDNYLKSFEGYGDMIIGHVYGHQHTDAFRFSKDNGVIFVTPSLSSEDHNPAMARRFFFDDSSFRLISYEQYWSDLDKSNKEEKITWELEYDTSLPPYSLPDLSKKSMEELFHRFLKDETLFQKYYAYNQVLQKQAKCGFRCKRLQVCAIQETYYDPFIVCLLLGPKKSQEANNQIIEPI